MALAETADLAIRINLEGNAAAGVAKLNKQLNGLQRGVSRAGRGVGQIGAGLTRAGLLVGGAAVAGLTAAAKAAIDFEDAFAGIRKTVDEADLKAAGLSFDALEKSIRTMATEIPIAATELAAIGETAGALGIKAGDIEEFTRVVALMGVTTNLTSEQAADDFGRLGTVLGLTGDDFTELADSIVALGNAGASTESEITDITKRFAATAKQAGLTKEEMVGLASATASLGFEPERGGTALARVFANMATNIATANSKGKALGKGLGKSVKSLQQDINKGKGLSIFLDVLGEIRDMKPTEAAKFLKSIGVTNVSDRTIFLAMSQQLPEINRQLKIANDATGALSAESEKRFATIASKVQLFKNNLTEAGISIGEGMLPAIGRATDKLIAFLKLPSTQGDIKRLGEDIGAAIDGIDFDEVLRTGRELVDIMKGALGFAKRLFDVFNALPGPLKSAAVGFLVLNKLSGGLLGAGVGNVVGGLGGAAATGLASRAPGVGRLFAQPVFVTNWPIGGTGAGGGVAGAAGKGGGVVGALGKALSIGSIVASVAAVVATQQEQSSNSTAQAQAISTGLDQSIAGKSLPELKVALAGVNQGIADLQSNPLHALVQGEALTELNSMKTKLENQITKQQESKTAITDMKTKIAAAQAETKRETTRGAMQTQASVRSSSQTNAAVISSAQNAAAGRIVAAIYAARPVVNVTNVQKTTTIQNRYGPGNGSSGRGSSTGSDSNLPP